MKKRCESSSVLYRVLTHSLPLLFILFTSCREQIVHNLSETDANRLINRLYKEDLKAEKVRQTDGLWALAVSQDEVPEALNLLEEHRELRISEVPEKNPGMFASTAEKKFNLTQILSGQIEKTLSSIKGVLEAHVHIRPEREILPWQSMNQNESKESASVLLVINEDYVTTSEDIQRLVTGATGVEQGNIAVISNKASAAKSLEIESSGTINTSSAEVESKYFNLINILFGISLIGIIAFAIRRKNERNVLRSRLMLAEEGEHAS